MSILIVICWAMFLVPFAVILLWFFGSFINAKNEAKAISNLADKFESENGNL